VHLVVALRRTELPFATDVHVVVLSWAGLLHALLSWAAGRVAFMVMAVFFS
jgi:hypothetical protein